MSAIVYDKALERGDGIRRYRTRCRVRIDSHDRADPLFISDDVVSISSGKTVKGMGQANLLLTPTRNYLNLIRPNDYINIYFNIGDGQGWTRQFFGFIDRVEESYSVDSSGIPTTSYTLACSDFLKALEKTQIYFNPQIAGRPDLNGEAYGTPNIGGLALMSKGIQAFGAPADIVVNTVLLMLGFGSQFVLPASYPTRFKDKFRSQRAQFIQGRLGEQARHALESAGTYQQLRERFRAEATGTARTIANAGGTSAENIQSILRDAGIGNNPDLRRALDAATDVGDTQRMAEVLADARLRREIQLDGDLLVTRDADRSSSRILEATTPDAAASLLDVIDVFSFVERTATDGFCAAAAVWQHQGSLMSLLRSVSHEMINELVFDLRPVVLGNASEMEALDYSRIPDDVGGNISDDGEPNGITHVPAMVFREYPFSTIAAVDLSGVRLNIGANTNADLGLIQFGGIFADRPNEPGRHVSFIDNINLSDLKSGRGGVLAPKYLDVAVVYDEEILKTQFGRSDAEHYNFLEMTTDSLLGASAKFYLNDLMPIVTPVHIMRHGLRVRSLTTRFAKFSIASQRPAESEAQSADSDENQQTQEDAEPTPIPDVSPGDLAIPASRADGAGFHPGSATRSQQQVRWGYREKTNIGPNGSWVFHQGIDIGPGAKQNTAAAFAIPIYAIADGEVVVSAPKGCATGYGNCVVIRHKINGQTFYSSYNHLSSRTVGPGLSTSSATRRDRPVYFARGCAQPNGSMEPIRVTKGQVIGTMGNTGIRDGDARNPPANPYGGTHLHFEISTKPMPRDDNKTPRYHFVAPPVSFTPEPGEVWSSTVTPAGESNRPAVPADVNSVDPIAFYAQNGIDLVRSINNGRIVLINGSAPTVAVEEAETEPEDFDPGLPGDEDSARPREDVRAEAGAEDPNPPAQSTASTPNVAVDAVPVRKQLIRWGLLQDHWYQHNLEYVNGRIEMRGAPEIRVGYRLDLIDRNMSFYVESVNHSWKYPDKMVTALQVTRGQRNDPHPMYVLPPVNATSATGTQRKTSSSRLHRYFLVPDPVAVRRSLSLRATGPHSSMSQGLKETALETTDSGVLVNSVDTFDNAVKYGEAVVLSGAAGSAEEGYSSALIQFSSYDFQESLFSADDALSAAFEVGGAFDDNSPITDGMVGGVDPSEQLLDSISEDVSDPGTIP